MAVARKNIPSDEEDEEEEEEAEEEKKTQKRRATDPVNIGEPLFFWIIVLVLALFARFVVAYTNTFPSGTDMYTLLSEASNFFLFNSGTIILPLIVGAVIGAEVGLKSKSIINSLKVGLLNALYAAIIYIIGIIIIYEILVYALPTALPGSGITTTFLINSLVLPQVVTLIIVTEVFAVLSHSRKVSA